MMSDKDCKDFYKQIERMMKKAEKEHLRRVAEMGCYVCSRPAEIHHIKDQFMLGKKADYLNVILNDMEESMLYKEGSTQYLSETLVRGENIRLYS